jgi:lipoprotein-anchoring transpeptidase ErfK/SrfK
MIWAKYGMMLSHKTREDLDFSSKEWIMKFSLRLCLISIALVGLALLPAVPTRAASPNVVIVRWGDTLAGIAARTGTTVQALMRANGLPNANFIYAGQRLVVPTTALAPALPTTSSVYTVSAGDTLATVAARFGTTPSEVMRVNGLRNPNFIYIGQRLNIPGRITLPAPQAPSAPANPPPTNPARLAPTAGKWIDIDLSEQRITAYQGTTPLKSVLVSTGVAWTPTPIGRFAIYTKLASQAMSGGSGANRYYLPGVPWVMYFTSAYAIHGTYWHHNFGTPMSHGCVNLTIDDAKWFYDWAEIGTPVIVHP